LKQINPGGFMMRYPPLEVIFSGEYACFTRPEMKVERVSYPIMTPSAARGALEAIFWHPEVAWRVREIRVLKPIRFFSILRNEISKRQSESAAKRWEKDGGGYFAEEDRTQRHSLVLRDVAYYVLADLVPQPQCTDDIAKYRDQFRRRVAKGQCFHRPYLGTREFAAAFREPQPDDVPCPLNEELGTMLFDLTYEKSHGERATPHFFQARLKEGILHVPDELYEEVIS
jgi:CRISPR-associated protein Cas5d